MNYIGYHWFLYRQRKRKKEKEKKIHYNKLITKEKTAIKLISLWKENTLRLNSRKALKYFILGF